MKFLFDEGLSPRLVHLLSDLFPNSESALRNGLAGVGDRRILAYAASNDFVLISTDSDFVQLLDESLNARVVILESCNYPTVVAAEVIRRNAIRIAQLALSLETKPILLLIR